MTFALQKVNHSKLNPYTHKIELKSQNAWKHLAGQYIKVECQGREFPLSIANAPNQAGIIECHVQDLPHNPMPKSLKANLDQETWHIQGPFGKAYYRDSDRPMILIAGGSGFAYIKAIVEAAIADNRNIHCYWGVRHPEFLYLDAQLNALAQDHSRFHYSPVVSEPNTQWTGLIGLVHQIALETHPNLSDFDIYMAGPFDMVFVAEKAFLTHGAQPEHLFADAFEFR